MNIGDSLAHYEARGFGEADAPVAVLLEVALQGLSGAFPDTFVCFGGAALVLFFGSSRISADLDLLVNGDQIPAAADVVAASSAALSQATQILNLGKVECSVVLDGADHIKISVSAISGRFFTIDVTRISSTIHSEIAEQPLSIESVPTATATFVTRNWMLLQKL